MKSKEILYGIIGLLLGVIITFAYTSSRSNYGMMRSNIGMMGINNVNPSLQKVTQIKQEEQEGKKLLQEIQTNIKSCTDLSQDNFEKIGDYIMRQHVGSSEKHAVMDENMIQMMGDAQNTQMHIALGKNATGCSTPTDSASNSGTIHMMGQ